MLCACVEEFGNALSRDGRRKMSSIDVIHRLVALDRIKASVRKRYESGDRDEGFNNLFIAIEWITELGRNIRADVVDSHDAPPKKLRHMRAEGARISRIREAKML